MKPLIAYVIGLVLIAAYTHVATSRLVIDEHKFKLVGMMEIKDGDRLIYTPVYQKIKGYN